MSKYKTEIDPNNSLQNIQLAIQGEEATGAEFISSNIEINNSINTNVAVFNDLPPGARPYSKLILLNSGAASPLGKKLVWSGVMIVSGSKQLISAYR
jgi:hypothetical protein